MTPRNFGFRPTAMALALASLGSLVHAQQAPAVAASAPPTAAPAATPEDKQVITVTATRRAERLQDVPLAVSVATGEQLANAGVLNITDIGNVVAGITYGSSPSDTGFRVRGVGALAGFTSTEQPVGVVVDNVVMGLGTPLTTMIDIDRVEVLKGPQGTQFGKNASSGVVSITTRRPRLRSFTGDFEGSYGSLNERRVQGSLNVPLGDIAAARVTLVDRAYDGFVTNVNRNEKWGGNHNYGARLKVLVAPTSTFDVLLSADAGKEDTKGPSQLWTLNRLPAGSTGTGYLAPGVVPGLTNTATNDEADAWVHAKSSGASAEVNYRLGGYTLTSVTAHRVRSQAQRFSLDVSANPTFMASDNTEFTQDSQEFRLTSPRGTLEYVAGAFWSRVKGRAQSSAWLNVGGPAYIPLGAGTAITDSVNTSSAVFADGKYRLTDQVALLAGLRLTRDTGSTLQTGEARQLSVLGDPPGFFVAPITAGTTQSGEFSGGKPSGRLGFEWKPDRDTLFYATVARGSLGPGVSFSQSGTRTDVKAQSVSDVTVGVKTELFDRRLGLNASVFYDVYKQLQVGVFHPEVAPPEFRTENAGGLRSKGFEVDATLRMGGGFVGRASVAYADSKFTDYVTQCPQTGDPSRCYTVAGTSLFQAAGETLPGAPKLTGAIGLDYSALVLGGYGLDASLSASARSKVNYGVGESDHKQGGYAIVNAAIKLSPESERWHVGLWARNLFNRHYQASVIGLPFAAPGGIVNWNTRDAARAVGVTVGAKF
jgi:iron complex outermembrane recepter protein